MNSSASDDMSSVSITKLTELDSMKELLPSKLHKCHIEIGDDMLKNIHPDMKQSGHCSLEEENHLFKNLGYVTIDKTECTKPEDIGPSKKKIIGPPFFCSWRNAHLPVLKLERGILRHSIVNPFMNLVLEVKPALYKVISFIFQVLLFFTLLSITRYCLMTPTAGVGFERLKKDFIFTPDQLVLGKVHGNIQWSEWGGQNLWTLKPLNKWNNSQINVKREDIV